MTSKTCLTVNCILTAAIVVFGMIIYVGCSDNNGSTYNGSYANGAAQSSTMEKSGTTSDASTAAQPQAQQKDAATATARSEYDAAIDRAKAENKPIYLLFSATWCGPCKTYKSTVLSDAEVKRCLERDVIYVHADIDRDKELSRKYNVSGVPTGFLIRVDSSGQIKTVNSHVGGLDKQEFMAFISK